MCDMGGMEAADAAAANMGTLWTDLKMKIGDSFILFFFLVSGVSCKASYEATFALVLYDSPLFESKAKQN